MTNTIVLVVVAAAVIGGAIAFARFSRSNRPATREVGQDETDFPPKPKWKPTVPVDIPRTVKTFAYYTDQKRAFAVFTHGTCVAAFTRDLVRVFLDHDVDPCDMRGGDPEIDRVMDEVDPEV